MQLECRDKVVFIAGSSRGIGKAIAEVCLREGGRVLVTGRNPSALRSTHDQLRKKHRGRVTSFAGDLEDPEVADDAICHMIERWGRMDCLVANIGTGTD